MAPQRSKLPTAIQFPLVLTLSLSLSSLLYSLAAGWTATPELAAVSTALDDWGSVFSLVAWRATELAIVWWVGLDGVDMAALSVLGRAPVLYLLTSYYHISPATALLSLGIDVLSTSLPFRLLRPLSAAHAYPTEIATTTSTTSTTAQTTLVTIKSTPPVTPPNSDIISSLPIQALTTILAATIYATALYTALASSYVPVLLATHFEDIPSVAAAYAASPVTLLPLTLILGLAARAFIFTPATAVPSFSAGSSAVPLKKPFDGATATLLETLEHNLWGFSEHTKVVIVRTAVAMLIVGVNTLLQAAVTIRGVEWEGAVGFAGVWVAATAVVGFGLGVVGAV